MNSDDYEGVCRSGSQEEFLLRSRGNPDFVQSLGDGWSQRAGAVIVFPLKL